MTKDLNFYSEIASNLGFSLSKFADKIINRVNKNEGFCPCVSEKERQAHPENDYTCPCSLMIEDVKKQGHCHCHLFIKGEK